MHRALVLLLLPLLAACGAPEGEPGAGAPAQPTEAVVAPQAACRELRWDGRPRRASLVLLVSDTMRRDRMGIYGDPRAAETPVFDAFASRNLWFARASSQAPWTKPSVATLFTGLYPSQHGVLSHPVRRARPGAAHGPAPGAEPPAVQEIDVLASGLVTLAELLREAGYRTGAVVGNPWMQRPFGFDQGFAHFDDEPAGWDCPGSEISARGLRWLESLAPGEPFFLYLHYMDSHGPYPALSAEEVARRREALAADSRETPPEAARRIAQLVKLEDGRPPGRVGVRPSLALLDLAYDRGVERFDRALGELLEGLAAHPAAGATAIVVTSDHGESLFERGYGSHGTALYDEELAVPLAAKLPGVTAEGPRVDCGVGLIDLLPTLCTYLGVPCPEPVFGRSLLAPGGAPPRFLAAEGVRRYHGHRSVRGERYKLIWEPGGERRGDAPYSLYDLARDPGETRNLLAPAHTTPEAERAFARLREELGAAVPAYAPPRRETAPLDAETERRLRELGYIE